MPPDHNMIKYCKTVSPSSMMFLLQTVRSVDNFPVMFMTEHQIEAWVSAERPCFGTGAAITTLDSSIIYNVQW